MARKSIRNQAVRIKLRKAEVFGASKENSSSLTPAIISMISNQEEQLPGGALPPPYDFKKLYSIFELSAHLRPNIDAYVVNIDAFGHHFKPSIDLTEADADTRIADAILYERMMAQEQGELPATADIEPTPEDVAQRKESLRKQARREFVKLKAFFNTVCPDLSFIELRRRTRQDLEVIGNAFWEVTRNSLKEIANFYYVKPLNVRLLPLENSPVKVEQRVQVTEITWATVNVRRLFRKFIMYPQNSNPIYFKEFGDMRLMSRLSGEYYADENAMREAEPDALPATEILHFYIHSPTSAYGIPRWTPTLSCVLGSAELDEVNYSYFTNNVVPPLALLCSGGRFGKGVASRIEDYIEEHLKGRKGMHRILVLEAEGQKGNLDSAPRTVPKVQFVPLRDSQQQDGLFQNYDLRNEDKIARMFRLPRILRGDDKQINRACYSEDTEVLTEIGWFRHADVPAGARIACFDKDSGRIAFETPLGYYETSYKGDMVHFANKQMDLLITPDHTMLYQRPQPILPWRVAKANEVKLARFIVPAAPKEWLGEWDPPEFFTLPCCEGCTDRTKGDHQPIPWNDWLAFVGQFVSDGGTLATAEKYRGNYAVQIRAIKSDGKERILDIARRLGWQYTEYTKKEDNTLLITFNHKCLWSYVREHFGGYQVERKLPFEYLLQSRSNLITLYEYLMGGDGWYDKKETVRGYAVYYTKSTLLADQIQTLTFLLGHRVSIRPGQGVWRVPHSYAQTTELCYEHDVRQIPYDGNVCCFSTRTGFYVTRRNNRIAIQGNTAFAELKMADEQVFEPEREWFDDIINRKALSSLNIVFWSFRSNAPIVRDPERLAEMLERLVKAGILLPKEARAIASDIFNENFQEISENWSNTPLPIIIAQLRQKNLDGILDFQASPPEPDIPVQPEAKGQAQGPMRRIGSPLRAMGADDEDKS